MWKSATHDIWLAKAAQNGDTAKYRHIMPNISECPGPISTYFIGFVDVFVGMIIPTFIWCSPKGRGYGNQLKLEDERPLLLASAFENRLADSKFTLKRLNGNIQATSCTNLVKLRSIFSEFMLSKRAIFAAIRPQFEYDLHSSPWHSKTDRKIAILISAE